MCYMSDGRVFWYAHCTVTCTRVAELCSVVCCSVVLCCVCVV